MPEIKAPMIPDLGELSKVEWFILHYKKLGNQPPAVHIAGQARRTFCGLVVDVSKKDQVIPATSLPAGAQSVVCGNCRRSWSRHLAYQDYRRRAADGP